MSPSLRGSGLKYPSHRLCNIDTGLPLYEGVDWNFPVISVCLVVAVSLFTREWIEIAIPDVPTKTSESPSLRGSGLKFLSGTPTGGKYESPSLRGSGLKLWLYYTTFVALESPSLRGSGLKSALHREAPTLTWVSLFTREWIEIESRLRKENWLIRSPSLRGSGLKLQRDILFSVNRRSLPLYEGVDWNDWICKFCCKPNVSLFTREWIEIFSSNSLLTRSMSPSLRGSGLKSSNGLEFWRKKPSPSLRGSGLKSALSTPNYTKKECLPLYEGVDWNRKRRWKAVGKAGLPLYEGVDWNFLSTNQHLSNQVSLFTREWIEIPSHIMRDEVGYVSLFTREWIEINCRWKGNQRTCCLPLYEGVDWNVWSTVL